LFFFPANAQLTSASPSLRYDIATLYLEQASWNLEEAIEAYKEDERWEKEHPLEVLEKQKKAGLSGGKGKSRQEVGMRRFVGGS
jgi:hypothetical protein